LSTSFSIYTTDFLKGKESEISGEEDATSDGNGWNSGPEQGVEHSKGVTLIGTFILTTN
jgi:hypothetical protein